MFQRLELAARLRSLKLAPPNEPIDGARVATWANAELIRLWRKPPTDANPSLLALMPMLYPPLMSRADLLFLGFNPAFSEKFIQSSNEKVKNAGALKISDFKWPAGIKSKRRLVKFEIHAKQHYTQYFGSLARFAEAIEPGSSWEHIDLFAMRNSTQANLVRPWSRSAREFNGMPEFLLRQLKISLEMICMLKPRRVVVINATASAIIEQALQLTSPDGGRSHRWHLIPDLPIFLGGMLSGQAAMDRYSSQRLKLDVLATQLSQEMPH